MMDKSLLRFKRFVFHVCKNNKVYENGIKTACPQVSGQAAKIK
jgi:hypothetical protein